jgi:zona occludens toxin (predicted ATPase)
MADCCNNLQLEPSLMTTNFQDIAGLQHHNTEGRNQFMTKITSREAMATSNIVTETPDEIFEMYKSTAT